MKFPQEPRKGDPVWQTVVEIIRYLRAITVTGVVGGRAQITPNGTTIVPPALPVAASGKNKRLPFEVVLFNAGDKDSPVWKVRIHPGYVNERLPGAGTEQTLAHAVGNQWDETNPDALATFAVAEGDGVYVSVSVLPDGTVGVVSEEDPPPDPVMFEIYPYDPGPESTHYQPKVDDETSDGAPGTYYYKLAEIQAPETEGGAPVLAKFLSGSHIDHFQELPSIRTTTGAGDGIGVIPKKWDNDGRNYALRALTKGLGGLGITTESDLVEVRGNKKSLDIYVDELDIESSTPIAQFVDGLETLGTDVVGDESPMPTVDEVRIKIPKVQQRTTDPQILVSDVGINTPVYQVEGNGVDSYLEITVNGDPGLTLNTKDGLVTEITGSPLNIDTSTIPDGSQGDMLYWDDTAGAWVLLANPGAPSSGFHKILEHNGTVPVYLNVEEQEITICVAGTPTTITVLKV